MKVMIIRKPEEMKDKYLSVWIGCTTRWFLKETVESLKKVLNHLGIKYKILDTIEICCGSVLFNTGQKERADANAKIIKKLFREKGVRKILSLCPGCTRTFKEHYKLKVEHISELLAKRIDGFDFKNKGRYTVTYHDPCHLGRHMGITEPPRKLILSIPNIEFKEMKMNRQNAFCCGSGGGVRAFNRELANYASTLRLMEAYETGAQYLITVCPFCERSFREAQVQMNVKNGIKVINLVDFVAGFIR